MDSAFHYPPELLELLVDTIPRLMRSKQSLLLFFQGAGVPKAIFSDIEQELKRSPAETNKYKMVRMILARLNERGESMLRQRREVIRRVTEFEDYSTCYENEVLKAKGLVGEIRRVVNVKDSFTRMQQAEEAARKETTTRRDQEQVALAAKKQELEAINQELGKLFGETNPQKRGKMLEGVLNRLFAAYGVSVKEEFERRNPGGDCLEQIDGVIELDGALYFVEMKWTKDSTSIGDVSTHLVRIYHRSSTRGLFISASGYSPAAIQVSTEALQQTVLILTTLQEVVLLLSQQHDLKDFLKAKINAAVLNKNPLHDVFGIFRPAR